MATEYCFLWIDWWPMCMTKAEWSGWMQAVFSVLAIVGAVLVAYAQHRQNLAQRLVAAGADRARSLAAPIAVAERSVLGFEFILKELSIPFGQDGIWGAPEEVEERLNELVHAYEALRVEAMPTYETVHSAQALRDGMRLIAMLLRECAQDKNSARMPSPDTLEAARRSLADAKGDIEVLLDEWRRAMAQGKALL